MLQIAQDVLEYALSTQDIFQIVKFSNTWLHSCKEVLY